MKKDFTVLDRREDNRYYAKFLSKIGTKKNDENFDIDYEWKKYILKKYFRENILLNVIEIIIGIILLSIITGSHSYLILKFGSLVSSISLMVAICLCVTGVFFLFANINCNIHAVDYIWTEQDKQNKTTTKIINFYKNRL